MWQAVAFLVLVNIQFNTGKMIYLGNIDKLCKESGTCSVLVKIFFELWSCLQDQLLVLLYIGVQAGGWEGGGVGGGLQPPKILVYSDFLGRKRN